MNVTLLDHTKLSNAVIGLRNCWQSYHKGGNYQDATDEITGTDREFLDRIINKHHHETGAEFITYIFRIEGISVGCQNQLVRHRHASFLVKSTRYCKPDGFVSSGNDDVDSIIKDTLERLQGVKASNDIAKYALPQGLATDVVMSINMRSLFNFLKLRLDKHAHPEIRQLAGEIYKQLPNAHRFLFTEYGMYN